MQRMHQPRLHKSSGEVKANPSRVMLRIQLNIVSFGFARRHITSQRKLEVLHHLRKSSSLQSLLEQRCDLDV